MSKETAGLFDQDQPKQKSTKKEMPQQERVFSGQKKAFHDLFILKTTKMLKLAGLKTDPDPLYVQVDHQHFYHTIDADGKPQTACGSIGGHFHLVEVEKAVDGGIPRVVSCSGPMTMVRRKVGTNYKIVPEPLENGDDHVHEVEYIKSDEITLRTKNLEAAKFTAAESLKGRTPPGVKA